LSAIHHIYFNTAYEIHRKKIFLPS